MKKEIRKSLERLQKAIERALKCDSIEMDLFPALFSVFIFLWCKSAVELMKKK